MGAVDQPETGAGGAGQPETGTETAGQTGGRLAVLFPGRGYNSTRPLLYYGKRLALQYGYDVLDLGYESFQDREDMLRVLPSAVENSARALLELGLDHYDRFCFLSKSFGTIVAGALAQRLGARELSGKTVRHFYMTPLRETLPYMVDGTYHAVIGMADYYTPMEEIRQLGWDARGDFTLLPGGTHSLEVEGDVIKSLALLRGAMLQLGGFLSKE